jgi:hypothetical protein
MARYNDASPHPDKWTNAKLMREARRVTSFNDFGSGHFDGKEPVTFHPGWSNQTGSPDLGDFVREHTRLYRDSWLNPILDEIERRFVK